MNHIDTMKQALEALEKAQPYLSEALQKIGSMDAYETDRECGCAITALRLAIEQAERQEPVCETTAWAQVFGAGVKAGRTYLAPKEQEPVAKLGPRQPLWSNLDALAKNPQAAIDAFGVEWAGRTAASAMEQLAAPPQRQPLIPEALQVIDDLYDWRTTEGRMKAYRAVERGHGIGGEA